MKKRDFYYELPQELIAQRPLERRDASRMLSVKRGSGDIEHKHFYDLPDFLNAGDLLIMNDSRVLPARLYGVKEGDGAGAKVETLLLKQRSADEWECIVKPGRKLRSGARVRFGEELLGEITEVLSDGNRIMKFEYDGNFFDILDRVGILPLPHYITEELEDGERYQTVYSKELGSAAAPTAGLHFTDEIIEKLHAKGINTAFVTLHVGLGTFRPVKEEEIEEHKMHTESYSISEETAELIKKTKAQGGRVIAVGTTSCRTLESVAKKCGDICADEGSTDIFIYPGYKFKVIDGLITNFHLPESTLIMLVSAFAGYENTMKCYREAVEEKYRFYSLGDAMLIL